jgi:dihydrofolate reductase
MKVSLYLAVTPNGLITYGQDDSDWVNDWEVFTSKIKDSGCVAMGRRTYECAGELFPYQNAFNIVTSSTLSPKEDPNYIIGNFSPQEMVKQAQDRGFDHMLLVGGSKTVKHFLEEGLINEIILTIHPLLFGQGKPIFESIDSFRKELKLIAVEQIKSPLVTISYQIIN